MKDDEPVDSESGGTYTLEGKSKAAIGDMTVVAAMQEELADRLGVSISFSGFKGNMFTRKEYTFEVKGRYWRVEMFRDINMITMKFAKAVTDG